MAGACGRLVGGAWLALSGIYAVCQNRGGGLENGSAVREKVDEDGKIGGGFYGIRGWSDWTGGKGRVMSACDWMKGRIFVSTAFTANLGRGMERSGDGGASRDAGHAGCDASFRWFGVFFQWWMVGKGRWWWILI